MPRASDVYGKSGIKSMHRGYLSYVANVTPGDQRPILYLDGPDAACTRELLHAGVDEARLRPCNNKFADARAIETLTGVKCVVGDICRIAAEATVDEYTAVWFDMTCTDINLLEIMHCAGHQMFTLNCRGYDTRMSESELVDALKAQGATVMNHGAYVGKGGHLNMVYAFIVMKKGVCRPKMVQDTDSASPKQQQEQQYAHPEMRAISDRLEDWFAVPLRVPITRWTDHGIPINPEHYPIENGCLLATVVNIRDGGLVLRYKTAGGHMMADLTMVEKSLPRITPAIARSWRA